MSGFRVDVRADVKGLARDLTRIQRSAIPRARRDALNRAIQKTETDLVREVSRAQKVKQKLLRQRYNSLMQAKGKRFVIRKATNARGIVEMTVYLRGIPVIQLINNPARYLPGSGHKRRKVRARGKTYKKAFVNRVRSSGQMQVLVRTGESRTPIDVVKVPVARLLEDRGKHIAETTGADTFRKEFERRLGVLLNR